jgi:DNA modification methylase
VRHRFHALCPYFAMFPEAFVRKHLVWSKPGDIVFDPFSGRGTTVFESLLNNRVGYGCDLNSVGVCVSNAKADPPRYVELCARIDELSTSKIEQDRTLSGDEFFRACFHADTLQQLLFLRRTLKWKTNRSDRFIAALVLGSLHGESHRSERYFSNRMPRTISTKPVYSVGWWKRHKLIAPRRDVFKILKEMVDFRFASEPANSRGKVKQIDARKAINAFPELEGRVPLIITSPPYLDTTNFEEDQWLRLWFLGGPPRPSVRPDGDDRHGDEDKYWSFLTEAWAGLAPMLKRNAHIIVRIGGKRLSKSDIEDGLTDSLEDGLERKLHLLEAKSSEIMSGQLRTFQSKPSSTNSTEHDFHFVVR